MIESTDLVTVFAWQKFRELAGSRQLTLERLVRRAHEGLGHPEINRFLRILRVSHVKPETLEIAKDLKGSVRQSFQTPAARRHSAPPRENLHFNALAGVDSVTLRNHKHDTVPALNICDYSSHLPISDSHGEQHGPGREISISTMAEVVWRAVQGLWRSWQGV